MSSITHTNDNNMITDEIRQFTERREQRAKELGIALYVLGDEPQKDFDICIQFLYLIIYIGLQQISCHKKNILTSAILY